MTRAPEAAVPAEDRPATYREVFGVAEFRFLFGAYLLSLIGDQLAKVALSILVFQQTDSAFLSAATFAVGYLPWIIGGPLLSGYADRLPRRQVLIGCDLIRMVLIAALAIPGIPLPALVGLLAVANLFTPPFEAARSATLPEVLPGDRYAVGLAVSNLTGQLAQVIGFLTGGALVILLSARTSLLLDALTFAISAALLGVGVLARDRPIAGGAGGTIWSDSVQGVRTIFGDRRVGLLILMLWVASAATYAPEGLAVPLSRELGGGPAAVGMLLAANPLGVILGGVLVGRLTRPSRRMRLMLPLAVLAVLALVPVGFVRWLPAVLALYLLSGLGFCFIIPLNVMVVRLIAPSVRGRAFGVISTGLQALQGLAIVAAGLVADRVAASTVVTLSGVAGTVLVGVIAARTWTWPADD